VSSLAGFVPLLLARGFGSGSRVSIGTVVFFGLLVATLLSLFVVPVLYRIIKGWELRMFSRRQAEVRPHSSG
jgi:multidrug efflux pump subunit AcrB